MFTSMIVRERAAEETTANITNIVIVVLAVAKHQIICKAKFTVVVKIELAAASRMCFCMIDPLLLESVEPSMQCGPQ